MSLAGLPGNDGDKTNHPEEEEEKVMKKKKRSECKKERLEIVGTDEERGEDVIMH